MTNQSNHTSIPSGDSNFPNDEENCTSRRQFVARVAHGAAVLGTGIIAMRAEEARAAPACGAQKP